MNKKTINNLVSFLSIVVIGVATVGILSFIFPDDTIKIATVPNVEQPLATTTNPTKALKTLVLNAQPYTPSKDVLGNPEAYDTQAVRIILNGDFQTAQLHVVGTVTGKGTHFLNLVYGNTGGILNAHRQSGTTLNINETKNSGGAFTDQNPIDITLDLLNPIQFASTRTEYEGNQQTYKLVNLWQSNLLPPTYINLLVAPFNEDGVYGGAQTTSIFEYSCSGEAVCQVAVCPKGQYITACMLNKFGAYAAENWCKRAGYKNCSF